MSQVRALTFLVCLIFRRLIGSWKTIVLLGFIACIGCLTALGGLHRPLTAEILGRHIALNLLQGFVLPLSALAFGTATLGELKDQKSLLYLLVRPLSRTGIYLSLFLAAFPAAAGVSLAGLLLQGGLAGLLVGSEAAVVLWAFWPGMLLAAAVYVALFQLFSALFRHPIAISLCYALFIEGFVGRMPGILKRISIRFYADCLAIERAGAGSLGMGKKEMGLIVPIDGTVAMWTLVILACVLLAAGAWLFARREPREL